MSDHRTWGTTRDCKGCRFWSEMIARSRAAFGISALCLAPTGPGHPPAPNAGKFTGERVTCAAWLNGDRGAVDDPGGDPYAIEDEDDPEFREERIDGLPDLPERLPRPIPPPFDEATERAFLSIMTGKKP